MTYNEFLAKGGTVPKYLNYMPAFSISSATTEETTFKELVALTWGNVEMREDSVALIQGDLNSVAFLVCSEYADKIANYIPLINAYIDDEEKEIHTGTDTNTRTPDLTTTTEGKAAPNGGASFSSAFSTGGDISKATGTEKNLRTVKPSPARDPGIMTPRRSQSINGKFTPSTVPLWRNSEYCSKRGWRDGH